MPDTVPAAPDIDRLTGLDGPVKASESGQNHTPPPTPPNFLFLCSVRYRRRFSAVHYRCGPSPLPPLLRLRHVDGVLRPKARRDRQQSRIELHKGCVRCAMGLVVLVPVASDSSRWVAERASSKCSVAPLAPIVTSGVKATRGSKADRRPLARAARASC